MKPIIAAAVIAAAAGGCASPSAAGGGTTVTVAFGSEAMGVDGKALADIEALAAASPLVKAHDTKVWGREGERTVTLTAADPAAARALLAEVRRALPARAAKGYIDVKGPGGEAVHISNR